MPESGHARRKRWRPYEVSGIRRTTGPILAERLQDFLAVVSALHIFLVERYTWSHTSSQWFAGSINLARIRSVGLDRPDLIRAFPLNILQERVSVRVKDIPLLPRTARLPLEDQVRLPATDDTVKQPVAGIEEFLPLPEWQLIDQPGGEAVRMIIQIQTALCDVLLHVIEAPLLDLLREGIGRNDVQPASGALLEGDLKRVVVDAAVIAGHFSEGAKLRIRSRQFPARERS